jgi:hypothetical protein
VAPDLFERLGGGSSDSWEFDLPSASREDFKNLFDPSKYVKAGAGVGGGLLAWGTLSGDILKTAIAIVGTGIATDIGNLIEANVSTVTGFGEFLNALIHVTGSSGVEAAFGTALAEFNASIGEFGAVAWVLAVLEVVAIVALLFAVARRVV